MVLGGGIGEGMEMVGGLKLGFGCGFGVGFI